MEYTRANSFRLRLELAETDPPEGLQASELEPGKALHWRKISPGRAVSPNRVRNASDGVLRHARVRQLGGGFGEPLDRRLDQL